MEQSSEDLSPRHPQLRALCSPQKRIQGQGAISPALPLTICTTLSELLTQSVPQFFHLCNGLIMAH